MLLTHWYMSIKKYHSQEGIDLVVVLLLKLDFKCRNSTWNCGTGTAYFFHHCYTHQQRVSTKNKKQMYNHEMFTCAPLISPKQCASATITTPTATAGYRGPPGASPAGPGAEAPRTVLTNTRVPSSSASMARQNCRLRNSSGERG